MQPLAERGTGRSSDDAKPAPLLSWTDGGYWSQEVMKVTVSNSDGVHRRSREAQANLDEIFRAKNVRPIESADDLACDGIFDTDEELNEFLEYTYAARRRDLA